MVTEAAGAKPQLRFWEKRSVSMARRFAGVLALAGVVATAFSPSASADEVVDPCRLATLSGACDLIVLTDNWRQSDDFSALPQLFDAIRETEPDVRMYATYWIVR